MLKWFANLLGLDWYSEKEYTEKYRNGERSGVFPGSSQNGIFTGFSGISRLIDAVIARLAGNELTGAEREANAFNAAEAQKSRDFTEYMTRNKYQMETESMEAAGINPAMMYGGGNLVPTAANGSQASSVSPSPGQLFDTIGTLMRLPSEIKNLKAQADLTKAEAGKANAEKANLEQNTANAKQQFDFNEIVNPLKVEAQKVANNLSRAQTDKVYNEIDSIRENIKKTIAETDSEKERKKLYTAEAMLARANARQVIEMLPYSKALAEAQTSQAYAAASLASVQAAYQQKLIDAGQVEAVIAELEANAKSAEDKSRIQKTKADIYNGTYEPDYSGSLLSDVYEWTKSELVAPTLSGIVQFVDNINPLSGILK